MAWRVLGVGGEGPSADPLTKPKGVDEWLDWALGARWGTEGAPPAALGHGGQSIRCARSGNTEIALSLNGLQGEVYVAYHLPAAPPERPHSGPLPAGVYPIAWDTNTYCGMVELDYNQPYKN